MDKYYIITFENTHAAMNGETILKSENINIDIMPTPTAITKSCGISIRFKYDSLDKIKLLVNEDKLKVKNIYVKDVTNYNLVEI